jgi:DNA-binding MarR family transcriptional regulator
VTKDRTGAPHFPIDRINLVNECPGISPTDKAVLNALAIKHNAERGYAFPSVKALAQQTGFVPRTITRVFQRLGKKGLLQRSYRDSDPTQSRKSLIDWNKLQEMRVAVEPWEGKKNKETAIATREEDERVADTLDTPAEQPSGRTGALRSPLDVVQESKALLEKYFSGHPTFQESDAETMMYRCVWDSLATAESAEQCLAVFEWICMDPSNEGKRSKIRASAKLAGYINHCFKGWINSFIAADKVNHPNYQRCLTALCGDDDHMHFSEEQATFVQPFRAWLESKVGQHLVDIEMIVDDDGIYLRVELDAEFRAARLLEFQDYEQPNSLVDEEHDE